MSEEKIRRVVVAMEIGVRPHADGGWIVTVGRRQATFRSETEALECAAHVAELLQGRRMGRPKANSVLAALRLIVGANALRQIGMRVQPTDAAERPKRSTAPRSRTGESGP